jgi:methylenetetrahydrofolate reductase (NADPH)
VQANVLPTIFHIDFPEELTDEVEKCKDNAAVRQVGVEWAVAQSKELMKFGVPTLHFYSMGKSDPIYRIAKELF